MQSNTGPKECELVDTSTGDIFACEVSRIERIGPLTRIVFTVPQVIPYRDSDIERLIVARIIVPTEMIPAILVQIGTVPKTVMSCTGEQSERPDNGRPN